MQIDFSSIDILRKMNIERSALWEIGVFIALALLFDQLFFAGDRFWSVSPHPFWVLVILICVQYGTNEGLLAAAASGLSLLLFNLPPQTLQQDLFSYSFMLSERPLMWLVAAVVIGELQSRKNQDLRAREAELAEKTHDLSKLTQAYDRLNHTKQILEERLAGQLNTAIELYQGIHQVESLEQPLILNRAADLIAKVTGAEQLSIYLLDNNQLRETAHHGQPAGEGVYDNGSPLFQAMVVERRSLVANQYADRVLLEGGSALCCPIICREQDRVLGMLRLNEIAFLRLNLITLKTVEVMADWIATLLVNAERFQASERERLIRDSGIFSGRFYRQHCEFVHYLAARIGFNVCLLRIKLSDINSEDRRDEAIKLVQQGVASCLRQNDLLFDIADNGQAFALVLTDTALADCAVVEKKLKQTLRQLKIQHRVEFEIESHYEWLHQYDSEIVS